MTLPAQLEHYVKAIRDKTTPVEIRQNYYNNIKAINDELTLVLNEFILEFSSSKSSHPPKKKK